MTGRRLTITFTPSTEHPQYTVTMEDRAFELTKVCGDEVEVLREVLGWVTEGLTDGK